MTIALAGRLVLVEGQNLLGFHGGAAFGTLAGARSALTGSAAMVGNVAGIVDRDQMSWMAAAEMPQGNPDLKYIAGAVVLPTASGHFGLAAELHGFDLYREQALSLGYARQLLENLSAGVKMSWHQLVIAEHGSRAYLTGEVGIQSALSDQVTLGFTAHLPFRTSLVENESLPSLLRFGLRYQPVEHIFVLADLMKQSDQRESLAVALEYALMDSFAVRLGVASSPPIVAFGVAYRHSSGMRLDTGTLVHRQLGMSPLLSLSNDR